MKHALILIAGIALIVVGVYFFPFGNSAPSVTSFEECVAQGNAVMESYPRQCRDSAGNLHVEDVTADWETSYTNASPDLVQNVSVTAGDTVSSPLTVTGEARGYWFFEASFPVTIVDWDGKIIAEHYATAGTGAPGEEVNWMTEAFVPFTTTITFETPVQVGVINRGAIILHRDNPSGMPENDAAVEIPVVFE